MAKFVRQWHRGELPPANINQRRNGGAFCPNCESGIHYEGEATGKWICADCGTKWKGKAISRAA